MAKDPAFLFYYKDILVSCADWDADEVGWYTRLLSHQADKPQGLDPDLESLAALAGVKFSQYEHFVKRWEARIKKKYVLNEEGLLINIVQRDNLEKRRGYKGDQSEKGLFGYYVKLAKKEVIRLGLAWDTLEAEIKDLLHSGINKENSKEANKANFKQMLENFKPIAEALASSTKGDANAIVIVNTNTEIGGLEGRVELGSNFLCPEMLRAYIEKSPLYGPDEMKDYPALQSIASYIFKQEKIPGDFIGGQGKIIEVWRGLSASIQGNAFYRQKSLKTISNNIQELYQIYKHGGAKENRGSLKTKHQSSGEGGY